MLTKFKDLVMSIPSPMYDAGHSVSDANTYLQLRSFEAKVNKRLSIERLYEIQNNLDCLNEMQLQKKALKFELLILKQNNEFDNLAQQMYKGSLSFEKGGQ